MKLDIELVPSTCWFSNVRSAVTKAQWDNIRYQVYSKAYSICEICGEIGPKHPVEAHEIWYYDDKKLIQKLIGMIALCPACHQVKHFGFARVQRKEAEALAHFIKVNKITKSKAEKYIENVFEIWAERSNKDWKLDISHLKEYGIDITKIKKR